jgi:L-lactate dehydrogenase complex protein LldE
MVREHFPHLLHDEVAWEPGMKRLTAKTYEFVEFLDKVLKVDFAQFKLPVPETVTYHYTCHLRGLGVKDEGVRLLKQMGNVDFVAMDKTDQCCGFGGTFAVKYPEISGAIVEDKVACIAATKARTTVCNDAGCTMNISGMCHRGDVPTKVRHIAELMAEAMGLDLAQW